MFLREEYDYDAYETEQERQHRVARREAAAWEQADREEENRTQEDKKDGGTL